MAGEDRPRLSAQDENRLGIEGLTREECAAMIRLIGLCISIGLADSLNPSTIAVALYLATGERPGQLLRAAMP